MVKYKNKNLIVIPAYNEGKSISGVIEAIRKYNPSVDILVINDGSDDLTEKEVNQAMSCDSEVYLVNLPYNMGIGAAIQTGFKFAKEKGYDLCVQCDGDGQHPPHQIGKLIQLIIEENVDVAIGSRFRVKYSYKSTFSRTVGISILSTLISLGIGQRITDPTIGFRAFSRRAIKFFTCIYPTDYPEPESLVLAYRKKLKIKEVPIKIRERKTGVSSIGFFDAMYYMVKVSVAIIIDLFETMPEDF